MDLKNITIKKFHEGLKNGDFSVSEAVKDFFSLIKKENKEINAYLSLDEIGATKKAKEIDGLISKNKDFGILTGIPLAVKDNILIEGLSATAASKVLENYKAVYDATVIKKLKKADVIFLGKTNLDEFAMGSSTENSAFGATKNPHDLSRVPGGSSGGSAAAVAANMAVASLGSDTGGSIRQPASFCGVVGLKPTYGSVSRFGLIAMASSLDQIGTFGKTVEDAAILLSGITGQDSLDSTSALEAESIGQKIILDLESKDIKNLAIGIPEEYFVDSLDKEISSKIEEVIKYFEKSGIKIKKISLPNTKYALSCYYIIMPAEVSSNLERFDGVRYGEVSGIKRADLNLKDLYVKNRSAGFGDEAKRRIILGTFVLSSGYYDAYYAKAQKVRSLIKKDFDEAFKEVDVILTPVSPTKAFKIGEKINDPLSMYLSDIFTIPVNLAGLPAVSIPIKGVKGLPIGFQLIGRHWREADILGLGRLYEKIND